MQCLVPISLAVSAGKDVHRYPNPTPQRYAHYPNQLLAVFLNDAIKQMSCAHGNS
jgi:hypothetical protein